MEMSPSIWVAPFLGGCFLHVYGDVPGRLSLLLVAILVFSTHVEVFHEQIAPRLARYHLSSRGDIPIRMVDISGLTVGLSARERRYLRLHGFMLQQ